MSIFSQLLEGKISPSIALSEVETWFGQEELKSPVAAAIGTAISNAANLAGTAFGNAIVAETAAVEGWINAGITSVVGSSAATQLTPSVDLALMTWAEHAKAVVDAEVAAFRAKLAVPATTTTPTTTAPNPPQ